MSKRFGLTEIDVEIIVNILKNFRLQGKVFGSWARGTEKKFSDLDLCLIGSVSLEVIGQVQEALDASTLPVIVDLSRYEDLNPKFQALIDSEGVLIPFA